MITVSVSKLGTSIILNSKLMTPMYKHTYLIKQRCKPKNNISCDG